MPRELEVELQPAAPDRDPPGWVRLSPVGAVLVLALGSGIWFGIRGPEPVPVVPAAGSVGNLDATAPTIVVHVSGAVANPGLVGLGAGARVAAAIAAAGGALPDADLAGVNLASALRDGDQLRVPARGDPPGGTGVPGDPAQARVQVNRADVTQLQQLPGVGPVLAGRILAHRETYGPFTAVEDLLGVPGIGEGKLAAMRDYVDVS